MFIVTYCGSRKNERKLYILYGCMYFQIKKKKTVVGYGGHLEVGLGRTGRLSGFGKWCCHYPASALCQSSWHVSLGSWGCKTSRGWEALVHPALSPGLAESEQISKRKYANCKNADCLCIMTGSWRRCTTELLPASKQSSAWAFQTIRFPFTPISQG